MYCSRVIGENELNFVGGFYWFLVVPVRCLVYFMFFRLNADLLVMGKLGLVLESVCML